MQQHDSINCESRMNSHFLHFKFFGFFPSPVDCCYCCCASTVSSQFAPPTRFLVGCGNFLHLCFDFTIFFKILLRTQFELSAKISKGFFACVFYYSFIIVFTTVVLSVSLVACNSSSMLFVSTLFFDFWPRIYGYIQRCCYFCFIYTQTNTHTQTVCNVLLHFFSGLQWFFRITKSIFFKLTEVNLITFRVCEKFIHLSVYTQYYCGL